MTNRTQELGFVGSRENFTVRSLFNSPSLRLVLLAIEMSATTLPAQNPENTILAFRQNDKISAWRIDPKLLKLVADLDVKKAEQAKQVSDLLLYAVAKKGGNKECCYKKVADNVWSCCDGTFVTTTAATLKQIFQLAEGARGTPKSPPDPKLTPLMNALQKPTSFMAVKPDESKSVERMARDLSEPGWKDRKG